jgi:hypothetical protein
MSTRTVVCLTADLPEGLRFASEDGAYVVAEDGCSDA